MKDRIRALALAQKRETERHLCPNCSHTRKHKNDHCLSITIDGDVAKWQCWHCAFSGALRLHEERRPMPKPERKIDIEPADDLLMEQVYNFLARRGITRATARNAGVIGGIKFVDGQTQRVIGFPYRKGSNTYAVKWRSIDGKAFTQSGAANTLWLGETLQKGDPIVIVEGECDALALRQVGIPAVSVPNGANLSRVKIRSVSRSEGHKDHPIDEEIPYLWEARDLLHVTPKVIVAVDTDDPGNAFGEELARRIGRGKCFRALWPEGCKDANDTLVTHGPEVLRNCIANAQPWPVKGLYTAEHFSDRVEALYDKGLARGESTGFPEVDALYTIVPGQLCVVTGIPNMGKSAFIDHVMVNLAVQKDWRFAICSFENPPEVHIAKLCQLYSGKPFFDGPMERMSKEECGRSRSWVNDHFTFLYQSDGEQSPIEDIIDRLRASVLRYGIRGAIIDPANFVDRPKDSNETEWVSEALTKIKVFAMAYDIHIWFVAHPYKLRRGEDGKYTIPGGYDISGSAHWFNKADIGLTVHRPDFKTNGSEIHIWKCRFNWIGKQGKADLMYDPPTGRYFRPPPQKYGWERDD